MSSIAPNGQIRFLSNIPIDSNYENSLDFQTELEQRTYFLGQTPVHQQIGATRVRDGVISVNKLADELLSANYIMFQNLNFSSKWFYAFITDIEYINNNMSYVYYQIDDIQTWLFDVELTECFVEREHTDSDDMFEHLVDEGMNVSEYITGIKNAISLKTTSVIIFTSSKLEDGEIVDAVPHFYSGLPSGIGTLQFHVMDDDGTISTSGLNLIKEEITDMTNEQQAESIVGGICFPESFTYASSETGDYQIAYPQSLMFPARQTTLNGYTPKNKKMFNSPYCIYQLCTSEGQQVTYQPEFFNVPSNQQMAMLFPSVTMNPSILGVALAYKGESPYFNKSITFDSFPQFAFSIDGYKAWVASGGLAKTILHTAEGVTNGLVRTAGGVATENPVGAVSGLVSAGSSIADAVITMDVARTLPNDSKGQLNGSPLMANNNAEFYTCYCTIKKDVAESIDNYFTMFGYKINKVKKPSRRNRPHYTYLKTKGCHINGGAPADAIRRIETIYDNGVRFWVNPSEVGNYTTIDNSPT